MTKYILVIFAMQCGVPCESIETVAEPMTFEECRQKRLEKQHRYLMDQNLRVWGVCQIVEIS